MRLHDRYLFRELLTPLAFCLGGFLVIGVSFTFFTDLDKLQERKLHLLDSLQYILATLPGFFVLVLPITLLLALLYALTHHAKHHELTALRAAGISLWRLCAPYFIVGVAAGGLYFWLNEVAVPRGADWAEEILNRYVSTGDSPKAKLRFTKVGFSINPSHIWQVGEYDADQKIMINPIVKWTLPDGSWRAIQADRAVWSNESWTFFGAQLFVQTNQSGTLVFKGTTNEIAMTEFDERPRQILSDLKLSDSKSLRKSHSADVPLKDLRDYLRWHSNLPTADASLYRTKYYGRLAAPWTCVVVVLIAIPFGAPSGRRNLFYGVAGSIFICFSYFVLQQVSLTMGMSGHLPPWLAAWLPNLLFAGAGAVLICRLR